MQQIDRTALRVALAQRGWTQWQLARELGVAGNTFAGWASGAYRGPPGWVRKAEMALGLEPDALLEAGTKPR